MSQSYFSGLMSWVRKHNGNNQLVIGQRSISLFILKMYLHDRLVQKSYYKLKSNQSIQFKDSIDQICQISECTQKNNLEEKLLSQLTLVDEDEIFDTICIRGDMNEIITLLRDCSNGKAFAEQLKIVEDNKQLKVQDAPWFDSTQPQTCLSWIINEFEKQVTLLYYKHINFINHECVLQYWINNGNNIRRKVTDCVSTVIRLDQNILLQQYTSFIKDHKIDIQSLLSKFNDNQLESIFYLPLHQALTLQSLCEKQVLQIIRESYKQSILQELECLTKNDHHLQHQQASQQKLKKKKKQNKQKKLIHQVTQEKFPIVVQKEQENQDVTSDDNQDTEDWIVVTKKKKQKSPNHSNGSSSNKEKQLSLEQQEQQTQIQENRQQMEIEEISKNDFDNQEQIKVINQEEKQQNQQQQQQEQQQQDYQQQQLQQEQNISTPEKKKIIRKNLVLPKTIELIENPIDENLMNQAFQQMIKKLDLDIKEFIDQIRRDNDLQFPIRQLVFNRIQFIIQFLFKDAGVCLFGSCATRLALPDSDIDIGITGLETHQLNQKMDVIIEFLYKMNWIKRIKPIYPTQTTLPLIKLWVDPSIPFRNGNMNLPHIDLVCQSQLIQVDISFFGHIQHQGLTSTELTCFWLQEYQELKTITLLFKSLLKKRGLNDQSKGGISSFCLVLIVVAFLEYYYQQNGGFHSIGLATYKFLEFYGTKFNPHSMGIFYKGFDQNPFFYLEKEDFQLTIVSPITYDIISQSSSFVQTILQDINGLFNACENETKFFYEKAKFNKKKRGKKEERNLFYKEFAKLTPLFST
ncbi:unnamed protein product (macronuclear) [Paramecium tetraurelia]|uniref:Poly(A) RNA polymerase mitochondrial-like central palm domain-containing protein n=1 Tax=Paramecium tetraurelia TaxID=5888 RepID=A0C8N6_PARTE|nr:uncharacterized protein GSPATT00036288001 [Paramecium tetraurelia]CAK67153.1 unnamed protein product [Paramecium tetraurelia]|eukprot:XP_001434550.1 hypothetical protein (macronuclear) [Paramecium tetraurelia strain d4-2]